MSNTPRTFDWAPSRDERNMLYLISSLDCFQSGDERTRIMRTKTVWLDQGQEGACTGFGEEQVRALGPYRQQTSNELARAVYIEARKVDEYPGEDYEGSSVNGAMKAARVMGNVKDWHWCISMAEVRHALSYHGAVELGTYWYEGMYEPDPDGFVHPTGQIVGGHAIAIAGYGMMKGVRCYRLENSWGKDWGQNGGAWIPEPELQGLLENDGEIACPTKVRH